MIIDSMRTYLVPDESHIFNHILESTICSRKIVNGPIADDVSINHRHSKSKCICNRTVHLFPMHGGQFHFPTCILQCSRFGPNPLLHFDLKCTKKFRRAFPWQARDQRPVTWSREAQMRPPAWVALADHRPCSARGGGSRGKPNTAVEGVGFAR